MIRAFPHLIVGLAVCSAAFSAIGAPAPFQRVNSLERFSKEATEDWGLRLFPQPDGTALAVTSSHIRGTKAGSPAGVAIAKLDGAGKVVWFRWLNLQDHQLPRHTFIQTTNGIQLVRYDAQWQVVWKKLFPSKELEFLTDVREAKPSGFLVAGGRDFSIEKGKSLVFRLDDAGNKLWESAQHFPETKKEAWPAEAHPTDDGGVLTTGTVLMKGDADMWTTLARLDAKGKRIWHKAYPCGNASHLVPLAGGHLMLFGQGAHKECGAQWFDLYWLQTDEKGVTGKPTKG